MTTYCISSTNRSRPSVFRLGAAGGTDRLQPQPMPPNHSVDTPFDDPLEEVGEDEPVPPFSRPPQKSVPDEERERT